MQENNCVHKLSNQSRSWVVTLNKQKRIVYNDKAVEHLAGSIHPAWRYLVRCLGTADNMSCSPQRYAKPYVPFS